MTARLSSAQTRLWLFELLHGPSAAYTIPAMLELRGALDVECLRRALRAVVDHHEALRLRILVDAGEPRQIVAPANDLALPVTECSDTERALEIAAAEVRRPFDVQRGELLRARLIRIDEARHFLVMPIHHLACDGMSVRIVVRDLLNAYGRVRAHESIRWASAPSFLEVVARSAGEDSDLAHWRGRLTGVPDAITLPFDRERPDFPSLVGFVMHADLRTATVDGLRALARAQRTTPFVVFSACVHAFLARHTNQHEHVVGFATHGRDLPHADGTVGLFARLLAQRVAVDGEPSLRELIDRTRADVADAVAHDRVRFEDLVRELGAGGVRHRHPVFQVLIDHYGAGARSLAIDGLEATLRFLDTDTARFDLELIVREHATGDAELVMKGNADVFHRATIERMTRHLVALIDAMVSHPDVPTSQLPMLSDGEFLRALSLAKGPARALDPGLTLPELVLRRRADACVAVRDGERSYGLADLDRASASLARRLRSLGVGRGTVVAVWAERSWELVVAVVGIMRAGAVYLPLDPEQGEERLRAMVEDAAPALVLAATRSVAKASHMGRPIFEVDGYVAPEDVEVDDTAMDAAPGLVAYLLYTSGSTGRPKGVAVEHRAIVNRILWMQEQFVLTPGDRVLHKTSPGFDVSVWELFWPLAAGACLVIAEPNAQRDPDQLRLLLESNAITVVHFVPSMLAAFTGTGGLDGLEALRLIVSSGELLSPDLVARVRRACQAELWNLYGPTEAAIDVTAFRCTEDLARPSVPIGSPIWNTAVYVLDRHMRPVPPGVVGELYIGGIQVARGYWRRPRATAERFVPDPFGPRGARLYRTGDECRVDSGGTVEFIGRADRQIKLRGHRIELAEVEAALARVPGVAVGVVSLDATLPPRLVAHVQLEREANLTVDEIRDGVARVLPDVMVPTAYVLIDALPRLPSGKVARDRLPPVPRAGSDRRRDDDAPRSRVEQLLVEAWRETLGVGDVDLDRSFFLAGGDSIRSIELVARARRRGLEITVHDVFTAPTVRGLATRARKRSVPRVVESTPSTIILRNFGAGVENAYPLSSLLAGLVFESKTNPAYRVYPTSVTISGRLDEDALRSATAAIVARHPYLRSTIVVRPGMEPIQLVHRNVPDPLRIVDDDGFDAWLARERLTPFDWSTAPLLRLTCHRRSGDGFRLTLVEPFLDGWSATLVLTELLERYESLLDGQIPHLQPGPNGYEEFLDLERRALEDPKVRQFWAERLAGAEPALFARGSGRGAPGYCSDVRVEVAVSEDESRRLFATATELDVPVKSVLLATHVHALSRAVGGGDIITGLVTNVRPETTAGPRSIGMFLNTVPIRIPRPRGSWKELVLAAHAAEAATLPFRAYPYAQMLRDQRIAAISDTTFNFVHFHPYDRVGLRRRLRIEEIAARDQTYFPVTVHARRDPGGAGIGISVELDDDARRSEIGRGFPRLLRGSLEELFRAGPSGPVVAVAAGSREVRRVDRSAGVCLHTLFLRQAARNPDAVAIMHGHRRVSYGTLQGVVERMACGLRDAGVGPGDRVAVRLPRSPELVAAVLAILWRGASYTPIDPAWPVERAREVLVAARTHLLVGEAIAVDVPERSVASLERSAACPSPVDDAEAPAYLIFTSGSTGRPRGVVVPHRAVSNRLRWGWSAMPHGPGEIVAMRTPIGFVDAFTELFEGLLDGTTTFIVPDEVSTPDALVTELSTGCVTRATMVPTLVEEIMRLPRDLAGDLRSLRHLVVSGEPLSTRLAQETLRRMPHVALTNIYGSTEVAADVTAYRIRGDETEATIPIGRPIEGVTVAVVDENGEHVGPGVVGELTISGLAVGTGYFDDVRCTAERFVPDPSSEGERRFCTGDLARLGHDGELRCLGRIDRQIKIRGVRIEPAEIEAALARVDGVVRTMVGRRRGRDDRDLLVAYVESTIELDARRLRDAVRARLPAAAIPESFITVREWPRTPTGKLDWNALPEPDGRPPCVSEPPRTLVERMVAELYRRHLGVEFVARGADFFELGGQSLRAILLAGEAERVFEVDVSVTDVFDHPVLQELASVIEHRLARKLLAEPA